VRDVTEIVVMCVVIALELFLLFDWDESRLSEEQLARAWPPATRTLLLVPLLVHPLWIVAPPVHFWRTRRSLRGVFQGALWTAVVLFLAVAATAGVDETPDSWLATLMEVSLAGFATLMLWRSRRGGFVIPATSRRPNTARAPGLE
jgi:hypothetical protein